MDMEDGRIDRADFKDWAEVAVGSSSTVFTGTAYTVNITNGNTYRLIMNRNCAFTFSNPTGSGNACSFTLVLTQDQIGNRTATWPAAVRWQNGTTPTFASAPGDYDVITFVTKDGGTYWMGFVASRASHTTIGAIWAWGDGGGGETGQNSTTDYSSPVQVGALTTWGPLSIGFNLTGSIKTDGTLWTWGDNSNGSLGINTAAPVSSPTQVGALTNWKVISMGQAMAGAIKTDGTLWTWGVASYGMLGSNNSTTRSSPAQVGALSTWKDIRMGAWHGIALKTDGTVWVWGRNLDGELGQNDTTNRSSPVQVGAGTDWAFISHGVFFSLGIKTDGTLWSWGDNDNGQLGVGDILDRSSPTQVGSDTDWAEVSGNNDHTIGLRTDGTLWAWGTGITGCLGLNSTTSHSSPVQVGALTDWAGLPQSANCGARSAAIKKDGTIWTWGSSSAGTIGDGFAVDRSSPTQVGTLTSWRQINQGGDHAGGARLP